MLFMEKYIFEINRIWNQIENILMDSDSLKSARNFIDNIISEIETGKERASIRISSGIWKPNKYLKSAILLYFRLNNCKIIDCGDVKFFDKIPLRFQNEEDYNSSFVRIVPGGYVRKGVYLGKGVVVMPSFINVGTYIDDDTMIDMGSSIGSCVQIGKNCHISANVVLGGVLEPLNTNPVVIEDNCFIGAGSCIAEGIIVEEGAVISTGNFISNSTKIIDRNTGEIFSGRIPAYSVVIPGVLPNKDPLKPGLQCSVIVKRVDKETLKKTSINNILRFF